MSPVSELSFALGIYCSDELQREKKLSCNSMKQTLPVSTVEKVGVFERTWYLGINTSSSISKAVDLTTSYSEMAVHGYYCEEIGSKLPKEPTPRSDWRLNGSVSFFDELQTVGYESVPNLDSISDDRLADTLAFVLDAVCRSSPKITVFPEPHEPAALFFSPSKQTSFTLNFYCKRLVEYMCCSRPCFVLAIVYLARLTQRYPIFTLNDYNVHRLICTALVIAAKWQDDICYSSCHYARVSGVQSAEEMCKLEAYMLRCLDFRLFVTKETYEELEESFLQIAAKCL